MTVIVRDKDNLYYNKKAEVCDSANFDGLIVLTVKVGNTSFAVREDNVDFVS